MRDKLFQRNRKTWAYTDIGPITVSEWWYFGTLIIASAFGFAGVAGWPTFTTPGVVPYGVALALIFVVPVGIIKAMTGIEVTLNVLAEFIGGIWVQGNAVCQLEGAKILLRGCFRIVLMFCTARHELL